MSNQGFLVIFKKCPKCGITIEHTNQSLECPHKSKQDRRDRVRKKIKEILDLAQDFDDEEGDINFSEFWSHQILDLKDEYGNMLAVLAENQSLPKPIHDASFGTSCRYKMYYLAQQDMADWKKVL